MELNVDTVLEAVNDLHERTGKQVFTLTDIAEALSSGQRVTPSHRQAPTDAQGNLLPELGAALPAWVRVLNEILLHLGEEGKLPVMRTAMVTFPAE